MRARQGEDFSRDHFDLLPFINILMCTLGCLLLVTLSIAALSLGPSAGEGWIASQRDSTPATRKQPVLIEWDGTAVSAHLPAGRIQAKWTPPLDVGMFLIQREQTSEFTRLLDALASKTASQYALFAVRPSGFDSFVRLADAFRERNIQVGYEPIAQDRPVRLLAAGVGR